MPQKRTFKSKRQTCLTPSLLNNTTVRFAFQWPMY